MVAEIAVPIHAFALGLSKVRTHTHTQVKLSRRSLTDLLRAAAARLGEPVALAIRKAQKNVFAE